MFTMLSSLMITTIGSSLLSVTVKEFFQSESVNL